jgi:hypothetical protein
MRESCPTLLLLVLVAVAVSCSKRDDSVDVARASATTATDIGQWIWSETDATIFAESARSVPELVPTVWIGTVRASRDGTVRSQIALSPRVVGRPSVAVVVRFDDSFTTALTRQTDSLVASAVAMTLRSMLGAVSASGVRIDEVQLDYDCPERLLPAWSALIARLARDALVGQTVWVTSLVSHVRHSEYGDLFRAHVTGHILQVFDTGDRMSASFAGTIERLASGQRMPFRLGVGAFERDLARGRVTGHRDWFGATGTMARSEWYRGLWVFPGERPWVALLNRR